MLQSNICTSTQLKSPEFQRWMDSIGHPPMVMHRKLWEWAYIAQALDERGMLAPGKRGLGFAVGREPLVALFAARGCEIVATDLDEISAASAGWTSTGQHANDVSILNTQGLCDGLEFSDRVSFRVVNMNDIPDDLAGFDFIWSSCAIEHLGDIAATEIFMSRMMGCLLPGGVAVHTTEYNLTSNNETAEFGATVILRKSDLERIVTDLRTQGHQPQPLDLDVGDAEDDQVILHPPYEGYPCLKIWIGPHAATSVGLVVQAGNAAALEQSRVPRTVLRSPNTSRKTSMLQGMKTWLYPSSQLASKTNTANVKAERASSESTVLESVRQVYHLVLGREADTAGLTYFSGLMQSHGISSRDVANLLMCSDEFAVKSGMQRDPVEVQLDGYVMFARDSDRDIGGTIAKGGAYEPHVTAVVQQELAAGDTFLDVGANIGYFTMLAAHLVGARGKVLAVEPLDKNLQLIYAGIERNGFHHVNVLPFGASDEARVVKMVTDPNTSNALVQTAPSARKTSTFAITQTLDWMTSGTDRIDLMKIDIEGHEVFAWRGGKAMLERCRPRILTEFHPLAMQQNAGIDCSEYLQVLFAYAKTVQVVIAPNVLATCSTAEDVMEQWRQCDSRHGGAGSSHLDLFLVPRD